jgi:RNA polymerase sigma factor (sigma-70 family)
MENPADRLYIKIQLSLGEKGREKALNRIWHVYGKRLYFFISRIMHDGNLYRDDCFQEIMLKIYINLEKFTIDRPLKPWIFKIAYNCCIDFLKKENNNSYFNYDFDSAADIPNPEQEFVNNDLLKAIEKCMQDLSYEDLQIAFLRFFENMKFREISEILAINENTIKTRLTEIKRKLRSELKEWV